MILVGEAALVDDQPGVDLAARDRVEDAVVAQLDDLAERGRREREQQEGRRVEAGNAMRPAAASASDAASRATTSGPHAVAECGAGAQRAVAIAEPPQEPRR